MGSFARVTSLDALQTLAAAIQRFRGESAAVLDDLDIQLRRVLEWIHHDRKLFWQHELRRCEDAVTSAKLTLQQARTARRIEGHQPACSDEQRALDRAKRRLEVVRQKLQAVEHWEHTIDKAVEEFKQYRAGFASWLEIDLPQAVAVLDRMSRSLDNYVSLQTPQAQGEQLSTDKPDENPEKVDQEKDETPP